MAASATDLIARLERERRRLTRWIQAWDLTGTAPRPTRQGRPIAPAITSRSQAAIALSRIDAALRRWFEGRFGTCCRCDQPLAPERLRADPAEPLCGRCQRASNPVRTGDSAGPACADHRRRR